MSERGDHWGSAENSGAFHPPAGEPGKGDEENKDSMEGVIRIILVTIVMLVVCLGALGWFTNSPPAAIPDEIYVAKGELTNKLKNGSTSLLANDFDPDDSADLIVFAIIEQPTEGKLLFEPNGAFTYQHLEGDATTDKFVYKICDQAWPFEKCAKATVTIEINPEPNPFPEEIEEK